MLKDLKKDDVWRWTDAKGICWDSRREYMIEGVLGFCSCGDPESVARWVVDELIKIQNRKYGKYDSLPHMFFLYWTDSQEYTEHGTSIRGCWLTEKGEELLRDLKQVLQNEEENE